MKKGERYDVSGLIEAQYEPGSNNTVLRNLFGIIDPHEMDRVEVRSLAKTTDIFIREYDQEHQFSATDICSFHKTWLGEIYEWAGRYRNVNITKDDFTFAMAAQIPKLMEQFEQNQLARYTPCIFKNREEIIKALAEVHTELLLIHPFRDGNGRVARLLSTLMALQAGLPLLDFSLIGEHGKQEYITAVQAGMNRDYQPMEALFSEIIEKSLSASVG
ncbi:MAG: Fic family protein [Desulfobacterales bacterium]|nr:Fic family protein [Desulfobacterales bacterium]